MAVASGLTVMVLALVHLAVHRLRFLDAVPRSRWLSLAGGAAVAYVFLHVLPELAAHEDTLADVADGDVYAAEQLVYAVALLGLAAFYGLERLIRTVPRHREDGFRLHLASFALYNVLIGYLVVHREDDGPRGLFLFAVAMGLHFLTVDYGLRLDHRERYDRYGRWLLSAAVILGAAIGALTAIPEWGVAVLFALLAGSVVLNVLKEELPEERQSRFVPFAVGALGYGALLFVL